jgi:ADP-ribose pyrophosphatase YjhB (NUDIX family)
MPRHCSSCGAWIGARSPVTCAACDTAHWLNAKPAAGALVVHAGRLLLTQRAIEPWLDCWCAPSGFCGGDEHPADCAEREALEEAGIRIRIVGYLGQWIDEYTPAGPDGADPEYCAVSYFHAVPTGEPDVAVDPAEVSAFGWFEPDRLPEQLSPPGNGARIYAAWRDALASGRLETPLVDWLPSRSSVE